MLKKISLLFLAAVMGAGLVACNERDVAIGAGAVGGALIAGAVYDNHYHRDYRYGRGYYVDGTRYWDRYDGRYYYRHNRWYRDGRYHRRHYPGHRWHGLNETGEATVQLAALNSSSAVNAEAALASKYRISRQAARQVADSFNYVQRYGKFDGLSRIGLLEQDIQRVASGSNPSDASVMNVASTLGASAESVRALLLDVRDEYSLYAQGSVTEE